MITNKKRMPIFDILTVSNIFKLSFGKLNDAPFFRLNETFLGIDSRYSAKYLQGFPHTV